MKDRKITILYEGAASLNSPNSSPQRDPCFLEELSKDEAEVVELQMRCFQRNHLSTASQTDKVVVVQDEKEIIDLLAKQNHGKEASAQTETSQPTNSTKDMSVQTDQQDVSHHVTVLNRKLDEILDLLRGTLDASNKVNNLSDIVRWVSQNTSTPQPGGSVTIFPVEDQFLEIPARTITITTSPVVRVGRVAETVCASPPAKKALFNGATSTDVEIIPKVTTLQGPPKILSQAVLSASSLDIDQPRSSVLSLDVDQPRSASQFMDVDQSSSSVPSLEDDQPQSAHQSMDVDQPRSSDVDRPRSDVDKPRSSLPSLDVDQPRSASRSMDVEQSSATGSSSPVEGNNTIRSPLIEVSHQFNQRSSTFDDRQLILECNPTACIREIKDKSEVIPGNIEFRIRRDILADVKSKSCSNGNFLWMLTRQIYHDEELIGRNFFGRKGRKPISPRRKKCLKAAFLDSCGTSYKDFTKAVSSINNGIRTPRG